MTHGNIQPAVFNGLLPRKRNGPFIFFPYNNHNFVFISTRNQSHTVYKSVVQQLKREQFFVNITIRSYKKLGCSAIFEAHIFTRKSIILAFFLNVVWCLFSSITYMVCVLLPPSINDSPFSDCK